MFLKHPSKTPKTNKPTTTDLLEKTQKLSDEWFIKGLPERPKDQPSSKRKKEEEDLEEEKHTSPFIYE